MEQPEVGHALARWRNSFDPPMSRKTAGEIIGIPTHKVLSLEQGRKLKAGDMDTLRVGLPNVFAPDEVTEGVPNVPAEDEETLIPQGPVTRPEEKFPLLSADLRAMDRPLSDDTGVLSDLSGLRPVSNSEVQTFKQCRRKWWLEWHRKLRKREESPYGALAIGTRIHKALEALYDPGNPTNPFDALERAVTEDWTMYVHALRTRGLSVPLDAEEKFSANVHLERIMIEGYLKWLEETGADQFLEVTHTETYLEAPLTIPDHGKRVRLIGKLDMRIRRVTDGSRLFLDHKTVQNFTDPLKMLHMNEQMLHYHLLEYLSDVTEGNCDGAIYNMLRKVKRGERSKPPYYMREEVRHNSHEMHAYRQRLTGVISDILRVEAAIVAGRDPNVVAYPTPSRDCSWKCPFVDTCHMFDDGSRVESRINDQFVVSEPLDRYMSKEEKTSLTRLSVR